VNVLIVAEQFKKGGLETHILNQVSSLSPKIKFVFAFGAYEQTPALDDSTIYSLEDFTSGYTVKRLHSQVLQLVEIIEHEKIDVIHAHPFLSLLPALFASVLTGKPMVYTLHGALSLSGHSYSFAYSFLQRYFFTQMNASVITVRQDFVPTLTLDYGIKNFVYIPNSVRNAIRAARDLSGRWALLSRLDNESKSAILQLIYQIDELGIHAIDIYGVGQYRDDIAALIDSKNLNSRVRLCGWSRGLDDALSNMTYEGVIGHGQVALEGLAMGMPVLLLSYGRISGLIDRALYENIKTCNFVNIYLPDSSVTDIVRQLVDYRGNSDTYIFPDTVAHEFDNDTIQQKYTAFLEQVTYCHSVPLVDMWHSITRAMQENPVILEEEFLSSGFIEDLLQQHFPNNGLTIEPLLLEKLSRNVQTHTFQSQLKETSWQVEQQRQQIEQLTDQLAGQIEQQKQQIAQLLSWRGAAKSLLSATKRKLLRAM